jgi:hypothetical protein
MRHYGYKNSLQSSQTWYLENIFVMITGEPNKSIKHQKQYQQNSELYIFLKDIQICIDYTKQLYIFLTGVKIYLHYTTKLYISRKNYSNFYKYTNQLYIILKAIQICTECNSELYIFLTVIQICIEYSGELYIFLTVIQRAWLEIIDFSARWKWYKMKVLAK